MRDDDRTLEQVLRASGCPACGHQVAVPFYDGGAQPMATLAWPASREAATSMPRFALDFVRCVECGHISNAAFAYENVPYSEKPNLMFNRGGIWSSFLERIATLLARRLDAQDTVVEIGHGDGRFLAGLAARTPGGTFVGFDPHGCTQLDDARVSLRRELFDPAVHMRELRPALIISRHVLEHLDNPLGFVQRLSFCAGWCGIAPLLYLEVPCVDRAVATLRTVDFYYEHNSHFTTRSFTRMLERCRLRVERIERAYGDEIIYGLAHLGAGAEQAALAAESLGFRDGVAQATDRVRHQLAALAGQGVAVWGGTGKAAAFINRHGLDASRFPIVVDSDPDKAGTFVPGTGQVIRHRDWLLEHPVDVVIIPMHWRAQDVVEEMRTCGIRPLRVLIEFRGELVDFERDGHPYRIGGAAADA